MQIVDKNNGNILFGPWLLANFQTKELIEDYDKARDYILKNGVSQEKYDEFLKWKENATSKGVPEYMLTYDEYEATCIREEYPMVDFRYMPW